ncbi:saccharopine dehydrogenase NADP-binding domain-containing protein [Actinomadura sediminis]|uniref:Saccharopine dehydrogenase NADP-binding domain-containing protein n=1 Tax=Actinomadura sediminis TaxID=1038904 RepID=A0ABW3EN28_9ACTN
MRRAVVLGGYGAVGREVVAGLRGHVPEIVVAGRDLAKARAVPGTVPMRVDLREPFDAILDADAVVMCAERENARVARACAERGVHYVDVTASREILRRLEDLDGLAAANGASVVVSVGLAPGVTNLLAHRFAGTGRPVDIGVLLGSGERHGPSAVAWTLGSLGALRDLDESWTMRFPPPFGTRRVHRFPFPDQYTLPGRVRTGLALDSRAVTALLPRAARFRNARLLRAAAERVHVGGDGFAVAAASGGRVAALTGRRQSRASGLVAALAVRRLDGTPRGVRHLEAAAGPRFLDELAEHGFELHEYDAGDVTT